LIEIGGELGAEEAVGGGDGVMDLAEAGEGEVGERAADAVANGEGADEDGGGDDDAKERAGMAAGVKTEVAAEEEEEHQTGTRVLMG